MAGVVTTIIPQLESKYGKPITTQKVYRFPELHIRQMQSLYYQVADKLTLIGISVYISYFLPFFSGA